MRDYWLRQAGKAEDKALVERLWDLLVQVETREMPGFTFFLDPGQQALARSMLESWRQTVAYRCQGGFAGEPERCRLLLFPAAWAEFDFDQPGVTVLRVQGRFQFFQPGHRDILGSLLASGIKRELVGDILCTETGIWVAVAQEIVSAIQSQWTRVGPVPIELLPEAEPPLIQRPQGEERLVSLASPRMDALLAQSVGVGRQQAVQWIESGLVRLNWRECLKPDAEIRPGDWLSVQGFGRVLVKEQKGSSKKGRLLFKVEIWSKTGRGG
ncbi:RNA-binding protein YlmH, contains S4-like domain [Carboxydocella sporoproducens DSM 16521]|uniref:RNA-binding protein YlmH, contains S4-like domain n=2 Tax=Carboxydocella TaxID=178898 RepID=A0A1T4M9Y8_9FIRM|nr:MULTISPECIES: YlmH/Sll1252 family protein [Carboxydocella]AVX20981.1 RNA-binding protein YlmH, contains S4-like domain [Carboxydocella thermautotrophica]AVX31399.1 RNA-binding protein YlmH, contains S4-like domain [Carboxydocella thermautotrophica]SJZ63667.1 RNA-binding protein YlmH, contains S4-like domain [Carboxydocella sporoproducens DSM 16521]